MNYLAHLHLADHSATSPLGNLLGDFVKGPLALDLAPDLRIGIQLHRLVDGFTDRHPEHKAACTRFPAPWRRFAPIIVDLLYDHWLIRHWARFSQEDLPVFLARHYQGVLNARPFHAHCLPEGVPPMLRRMAEQQWLQSYRELAGVARALDGIGRRLRRPQPLGCALSVLTPEDWLAIEAGFLRFYPALLSFTTEQAGILEHAEQP